MHPALETFLKEYQIWLTATKESTVVTNEKFLEIQELVKESGFSEEISNRLYRAYHTLFQTNYLLMESHLRVKNVYANYSDEDKQIMKNKFSKQF